MSPQKTAIRPAQVLLPLGLGTALSLMGDATLYTVLPTHTADAGVTLASVGLLLGANRAVRLFLNGPVGLAYDRSPRRRLFVPALFIGALSTALYAATSGFWPLLAGRLLWGLAWSGIWVGGATVILDITTDTDRGRWTGLYQTWFFLGAALGSFAGGFFTDLMGYHATLWLGAAVTAAGGLVAHVILPETRDAHRSSRQMPESTVLPRLRSNKTLWGVATLQGINRFVTAGVLTATMALLVADRLSTIGLTLGAATLTGALMAGRTLLSTVAAPLAGTLSDRTGGRWQVMAGSLALGVASMLLIAWGWPWAILLGIVLGAATAGGVQALTITQTGDLAGQTQQGRAIGLLHTAGDLGSAIGPPVAYALLPWIDLAGVYLLCAALFGLGLVVVFWTRTSQPQVLRHPPN
ncbi:MAG: MFS transporter [Chloroflexota bacterium]